VGVLHRLSGGRIMSGPSHGHHDHAGHESHGHGPHGRGWRRLKPHSHDTAEKLDPELEASREGIRALWLSLLILGLTAAAQAGVVVVSGSVALLGDTLHNVADALTAVPLGLAFFLGRKAATRAFTYGFGRAEDLAGLLVVLVIAGSAVLAGWTAIDRLLDPRPVSHLGAVAIAGLLGFAGNEVVARYRTTVGRRIGSAALVADGLHARTDGFASLAVVAAAAGAGLGWGAASLKWRRG
jgi:cation diffusion facilitator family transporter